MPDTATPPMQRLPVLVSQRPLLEPLSNPSVSLAYACPCCGRTNDISVSLMAFKSHAEIPLGQVVLWTLIFMKSAPRAAEQPGRSCLLGR